MWVCGTEKSKEEGKRGELDCSNMKKEKDWSDKRWNDSNKKYYFNCYYKLWSCEIGKSEEEGKKGEFDCSSMKMEKDRSNNRWNDSNKIYYFNCYY